MVRTNAHTLRDGMAAALARDFEAAYPLLQQATTESPGDMRGWLWRAVASPSPADAAFCLRRVLLFEPTDVQVQHALGRLLVTQASAIAASGQPTQARSLAREAADLAPECDAVWVGLALLSEGPEERLQALRRASELNPEAPKTRMLLRDALLHAGITAAASDPDRARLLFREAAAVDPTDARVWQALARVATRASDALEALRELVRIAPERPGSRTALKRALAADAESLAASGSATEAAARWREAVTLDEHDAAMWLGLAAATTDRDEARRALEAARRTGSADPRISTLWTRWQLGFEPPQAAPAPLPHIDHVQVAAPAPAPLLVHPPVAAVSPRPVPIEPPPAAAVAVPTPPVVAQPPAAAGSSKRTVMVVDDSPTVRKILSMTLERAGYGVMSAPDGEAALVTLEATVPDLILLDISMPKLDGYEVCKRIRADARTAHVPVVMLSGKDAFFDKVKGRMAGATEYLTKPFATPAVLAVIGRQFEAETGAAHG